MKILVFAASGRKESLNRKIAAHVANQARSHGADATLKHIGEYEIPLYNGDFEDENGVPEEVRELKELIAEQDAVIVVSPEYNGSIPGTLKNVIDWASRPDKSYNAGHPFKNKFYMIMSASPGAFGGIRMQRHLMAVLSQLGAHIAGQMIAIPKANTVIDDNGKVSDEKLNSRIDSALEELISLVG